MLWAQGIFGKCLNILILIDFINYKREGKMSYDGYLAIAGVYDKLNKEIDYSKWASFFVFVCVSGTSIIKIIPRQLGRVQKT